MLSQRIELIYLLSYLLQLISFIKLYDRRKLGQVAPIIARE